MRKIVDLELDIDGLILEDGETVDKFIDKINEISNSNYEITCNVVYEEVIE